MSFVRNTDNIVPVFEAFQLVESKSKMVNGKKKTYQERTPLSTYTLSQAEEDPEEPEEP